MLYRINKFSCYYLKNIKLIVILIICIIFNLIALKSFKYNDILLYSLGCENDINNSILIPLYLSINFFYIYIAIKLFFEELDCMFQYIFLRYSTFYRWLFEKMIVIFLNTVIISLIFIIEIIIYMYFCGYHISMNDILKYFIIIVLLKYTLQQISIIIYLLFKKISFILDSIILMIPIILKSNFFDYSFANYYMKSGNIVLIMIFDIFIFIILYIILRKKYRRFFYDKTK